MVLLERDLHLNALSTAIRDAGEAGRVVLVYGEAGIGKTTLIEHFLKEQDNSWRILRGACDSLFTPRPLGPLYDIASQLSASNETQGQLLALLDSESNRGTIFSTVLSELKNEPTILAIEDVHWADEATLDLLKYLGRRIRQTMSLLILTYRDDEIGVDHPLRLLLGDLASSNALHRIPVTPLSKAAVSELAKNKNVDPIALHHITNGNPFFVTEALAVESGIPETVRDAVLARAARLSLSAREVLEAAAVIGSRMEAWLLSEMTGAESALMDECLAGGMLQDQGDYYAFRHELERQAILESMSMQRKIILNRMALDKLKESPKTRYDLARLADHAEGTRDPGTVVEFAPAAARQASAASSHREAAAQYARALRYADILPQEERAGLFENQSYEFWLNGQLGDAVSAQQAALAIWRQLGRKDQIGNCLRFLAQVSMFAGSLDAAQRYIAEALEIAEKLPPGPDLANAYSTKARIHMVFGEDDQTIVWGTRAIELAESQNATEVLITALNTVGNVEQAYHPETGQSKLKRSLNLALEHRMHEHVARAYGNLGEGEYYLRRYSSALDYDARAIDYAEKHDLDVFLFYTKRARAKIYLEQGRWMEAVAEANEVLHSNHIFPMTRAEMLVVLNRVHIRQGHPVVPETLEWLRDFAAVNVVLEKCSIAALFAEEAWLQGDLVKCRTEVEPIFQMVLHQPSFTREMGELSYWMWRTGAISEAPVNAATPYATQIAGDWKKAAAMWETFGCPYEQGMALMDGDETAQRTALEIFEWLEAQPIIEKLKQQMRAQGARIPRGPRPATREHPFQLTNREMEVLACLVDGLSNVAIAAKLSLSPRTVEHHIASIRHKMGVDSRNEAVARALKDKLIPTE